MRGKRGTAGQRAHALPMQEPGQERLGRADARRPERACGAACPRRSESRERRGASIWASSRASAPHRMKGRGRSGCFFARVQRSSRCGEANLGTVRRQTKNAPRSPMEPISRPENPGAICLDCGASAPMAEFPIASDYRLENAPANRAARPVSGGIAAGGHVRELSFSDAPDAVPQGDP
jgi:hypothetical protein